MKRAVIDIQVDGDLGYRPAFNAELGSLADLLLCHPAASWVDRQTMEVEQTQDGALAQAVLGS